MTGGRPSVHRDQDFYAWLADQAALLRTGNYPGLDSMKVAEELEEMAAQQRGKVVSLLRVILVHLLKWHYSRVRRSENSWRISLVTARIDVNDLLDDSRTLRNELPSLLVKAYRGARSVAGTEMRFTRREWQRLFRETCPWTESQILDEDFLPPIASDANGRS
ncbi:MAG TPA: DUF29 domain-containing protein [Candidatus Binataceae bacterium]|nr:DUF29 domain-containing protein [Candidatus Binataceae bacterium]